MRKEMKPYRCRLNMTEFYYRPDIGSGNLSKKGKIYTTARNGTQDRYYNIIHVDVRKNSEAHRVLLNRGYTVADSYNKTGFVFAKIPTSDFIPEEV